MFQSIPRLQESEEDLLVQNEFLDGVIRRDPLYERAYQVLADNHARLDDWQKVVECDEHVVALQPNNPVAHYDLACSYARTARRSEAMQALSRAVSLGFNDFPLMKKDHDLNPIRKEPYFTSLLQEVWERYHCG